MIYGIPETLICNRLITLNQNMGIIFDGCELSTDEAMLLRDALNGVIPGYVKMTTDTRLFIFTSDAVYCPEFDDGLIESIFTIQGEDVSDDEKPEILHKFINSDSFSKLSANDASNWIDTICKDNSERYTERKLAVLKVIAEAGACGIQ